MKADKGVASPQNVRNWTDGRGRKPCPVQRCGKIWTYKPSSDYVLPGCCRGTLEATRFEIFLGFKTVLLAVVIVKGLTQLLVLGCDFLPANRAVMDFGAEDIVFPIQNDKYRIRAIEVVGEIEALQEIHYRFIIKETITVDPGSTDVSVEILPTPEP